MFACAVSSRAALPASVAAGKAGAGVAGVHYVGDQHPHWARLTCLDTQKVSALVHEVMRPTQEHISDAVRAHASPTGESKAGQTAGR